MVKQAQGGQASQTFGTLVLVDNTAQQFCQRPQVKSIHSGDLAGPETDLLRLYWNGGAYLRPFA